MIKDKLTSEVTAIILKHVKSPKGRLTEISDLCRINRREFNVHGLSKMQLHRLLRLFYALILIASYDEFRRMMNEVNHVIGVYSEEYDFDLLDE